MKAIFARILRDLAPIRQGLRDAIGKRQRFAIEGVIAEQMRAEAIERAAGGGGIIDRITRLASHEVQNKAGLRDRNRLAHRH
jgi:hypothetical protein